MEMEEFLGNLAIKASFLSIMRQSLDVNVHCLKAMYPAQLVYNI